MKNFKYAFKNTIKSFIALPVLMGNFYIPKIELNVPKVEPKTEAVIEKTITYKIDTKNQLPLVALEKNTQITPGLSNLEKEQIETAKLQKSGNRNVIARESYQLTNDPGLAVKRALVKEAASANGIGAHWKILEAVWQIETGKSWDRSVSSYAGAQGPWQFMPGTWNKYKPQPNASIHSARDGAYAAANLLARAGLSSGNVDKALFAYNHSTSYVVKVKRIADSIIE